MRVFKSEGCPLAPEGSKAHAFRILRANYNKRLDPKEQRDGVVNDRSASFACLYCTQCGEHKEIKVT